MSATEEPLDLQAARDLAPIADLVADGAVRAAIVEMRAALEAEPRMRAERRLARLHRETLLHLSAATRLEKDATAGVLGAMDALRETARLSAAILDLIDELAAVCGQAGLRLTVRPSLRSASGGALDRRRVAQGCDVFISYARPDRADIVALAGQLQSADVTVWYDHKIAGGERFRDAIVANLDAAAAVVVLWSEHSIKSDWVVYEASRAHAAEKLVPLRKPTLPRECVPPPYPAVSNILLHGDHQALTTTLAGKGIPRRGAIKDAARIGGS